MSHFVCYMQEHTAALNPPHLLLLLFAEFSEFSFKGCHKSFRRMLVLANISQSREFCTTPLVEQTLTGIRLKYWG